MRKGARYLVVLPLTIAFLSSCVTTNAPLNALSPALLASQSDDLGKSNNTDDGGDTTLIGLAFSGGGTRASAYSFGLLKGLENTPIPGGNGRSLLQSVRLVSGVSGGSVTAAWFGLKGKAGLSDFREKYLIRDAEENLRKSVARPTNLLRAFSGGINDREGFGGWLDKNLFKGAKFSALLNNPRVTTWINASDVYNHTPFVFEQQTFRALCSDLASLPISEAVAASAAVPVIFSPIVLRAYGPKCAYSEPAWITTARHNPNGSTVLKSYAKAIASYRDPQKVKYVKLLDGGLTDNFGIAGFSLARGSAQTLYGPLSASEAVNLRRILFMVANAGHAPSAKWANEIAGPGGLDLLMAVTDTAISSSTREGYEAFRLAVNDWHQQLIDYRCSLSKKHVRKILRSKRKWRCEDLKLFVGQINFDQAPQAIRKKLNAIPTRLKLPVAQVDLTISAARSALRKNPTFNGFLRSIEGFSTKGKKRLTRLSVSDE